MYDELVKRGYFPVSPQTTRTRYQSFASVAIVALIIAAAIFGGAILDISGWFIVPAIAIFVILFALYQTAKYMPRKTVAGAESAAKWRAFKSYLADLDQQKIGDNAAGIFEKYLPYAVAFGLERTWVTPVCAGGCAGAGLVWRIRRVWRRLVRSRSRPAFGSADRLGWWTGLGRRPDRHRRAPSRRRRGCGSPGSAGYPVGERQGREVAPVDERRPLRPLRPGRYRFQGIQWLGQERWIQRRWPQLRWRRIWRRRWRRRRRRRPRVRMSRRCYRARLPGRRPRPGGVQSFASALAIR